MTFFQPSKRCRAVATITVFACLLLCGVAAFAHPLGNFTVNRFARVRVEAGAVRVRYVIDMAQIPAFQESQVMDVNHDGNVSAEESAGYLERLAPSLAEGVLLASDGERVPLRLASKTISMPKGAGGLATLRVECDFEATTPERAEGARRLRFEDANYRERVGWREIVVEAAAGVTVFDSDAYGSAATDELKTYPQDTLAAPLDERTA